MEQIGNLRKSKTLKDTMPGLLEMEPIGLQDKYKDKLQEHQSLEKPAILEQIQEPIRLNLEKTQTIEKDRLVPPVEEEIKNAHRELGVKMPSSPAKRANRLKKSKAKYDRRQQLINKAPVQQHSAEQKDADWKQFKSLADNPDFLDTFFSKKKGEKADEFFVNNYEQIQEKLSCLDNVSAMMNDEAQKERVKGYEAKIKTLQEIRHFYDLQGQLVSNKYYTMLPREEMQKLPYKELKRALLAEYGKKKEERNGELIKYYETLIKLKNCEVKDAKSAKESLNGAQEEEKKEEINKQGTHEHEMEKVVAGFTNFLMTEEADTFRTEGEKWRHYKVYFDVMDKDIQRYIDAKNLRLEDIEQSEESEETKKLLDMYRRYKENAYEKADDDIFDLERETAQHMQEDEDLKDETKLKKGDGSSGITMTDEQKEGLRLVQSWILRHASEKPWYRRRSKAIKNSQNALALRVVQMPPEQQLLVFYLMENNIQSDGDPSHFYDALKDYVPNKAAFKGSVGWDKLSMAVRQTTQTAAFIDEYAKLEGAVKGFQEEAEKNEDKNKEGSGANDEEVKMEKKRILFGEFAAHYSMIALLCQSVGLNKDNNMDPNLIEDKKMRDRIISEQQQANELLKELRKIGVSDKEAEGEKGGNQYRDKEKALMDAIDQYLPKESALKGGLEFLGGFGATVGATVGYAMTMHEGFFGILELGFAIYSAANIRLSSPTAAEQGAVAMDTIGSLLSGIGNTVVAMGSFLGGIAAEAGQTAMELAGQLVAHASGEIVLTETQLAEVTIGQATAEATAGAAYEAAVPLFQLGGAAVMVAGAAKMVSQGINIHRAKQNLKHAEKTEQLLETREEENGKLSKDERRLRRFVKHRKEGAKEEKRSAGLGMVSGAMTILAGGLMMTGVLAPLALIPTLIGVGFDIANAVVGSKRKKMLRKNAVDTYLQMDEMVEKVKKNHPYDWVRNMETKALKDQLRKEMLAQLGFSSVNECYKELMIGDAKLLYHKAFEDPEIGQDEREMYEEAIKSLGFKIKKAKDGDPNGENKPTIQMMVAKLMK